MRKEILEINDEATGPFPVKEIQDAQKKKRPDLEDTYEENLVNDIDYLMGVILKRGHCGHT